MLQNWLKPLSPAILKIADQADIAALGRQMTLHRTTQPDLRKVQVALIGLDEREADAIRTALYDTSYRFPAGAIADLGNLRKPNEASLLIPVLHELFSGKVLPLLIGGRDALARAQFLGYQEARNLVNLVAVDESLQSFPGQDGDVYGALLEPRHAQLLHFGLIGYQSHLMPGDRLDYLDKHHFEALRLGRSRPDIEETEPTIRDADLLAFHLGALKSCEAPGVEHPSPSGYFLEEACQLCRYAGMSDKLTSFGVYGFQRQRDREGQTAQVVSQLVWYFLEGYFHRKRDYPVSKDGLTEYIVEFRQMNYQLTFWKSTRSGRWWMQIPVDAGKKKYQRHLLVPCSYQDYQAACREELPERLMQAFKRFG